MTDEITTPPIDDAAPQAVEPAPAEAPAADPQPVDPQPVDPQPVDPQTIDVVPAPGPATPDPQPVDPQPVDVVPSPGPAGPDPQPEVPVPTDPSPAPGPAPIPVPVPLPTPADPTPDPTDPLPVDAAAAAPTATGGAHDAGRPGGRPGSRPGRRPGGRPGSRPGRGPGGAGQQSPTSTAGGPAVVEPMVEPTDHTQWGRIDDGGTVYVRTGEGERAVGNWQAGDADAGLAHYGRRFDDFSTEIALLEARLASGSGDPKSSKQQAVSLREQVPILAAVGDLDTAAERLEVVIGAADQAIAGASRARSQAKARAIAAKEALCVEAEALADSNQWKTSGDRLKTIVEQWRQITGIDRKADDALWKRFAKARDTFSRHRGAHFAELDKQRGAAKDVKEALIAQAQELSSSTEWGETAGAYRQLMTEWKAAGRAPRDVEDALWDRFRAAQEAFFSRRNQTFSERDSEFEANAAAKEKLLLEARGIDPIKDLDAARSTLRSIQERWEAAGKVPRERIRELDGQLRAVEDKVRTAEDSHWRRTDPETQARVAQFRARVDQFKTQAGKARAAGDERRARDADAQAEQWEQWLAAAENAVRS